MTRSCRSESRVSCGRRNSGEDSSSATVPPRPMSISTPTRPRSAAATSAARSPATSSIPIRWRSSAPGSPTPRGLRRSWKPNAMTLSTVDAEGQPSSRTVLLKAYDERGFVFFTNYESRKAREIAGQPARGDPLSLARAGTPGQDPGDRRAGQPHRDGEVFPVPSDRTPPRSLGLEPEPRRLVEVPPPREARGNEAEVRRRRDPCPDFWGGYRVEPTRFEFWQGGKDRIHDRFEYRREDGGWRIDRLAP